MVDLHGAVRCIDRALEGGVQHFIMVSAYRVDQVLSGPKPLRPYLAAKDAADRWLRASTLHHTILRPGRLTDEPGTGHVRTVLGDAPEEITIPREDVAAAVVAVLDDPVEEDRTVDLLSGPHPIDEVMRRPSA
ncbi:MAG: NAD(P)-binding oxidoreductase [Sandaracinaceae bacterium]